LSRVQHLVLKLNIITQQGVQNPLYFVAEWKRLLASSCTQNLYKTLHTV